MLMQMLFGLLKAQYTLQPTIPLAGMMQKSQLWNVLVVNNTNNQVNCRLELTLRDRVSGMEQLTASSSEFVLSKGAKQLTNGLLAPIQYNNINTIFTGRGNDELLPIGNYMACYRLVTVGIKPTDLAEECTQFDIEPLSPPMLAFPADSSLLNIQPAQFTWIPPTPQQLFNRLYYEVMITEILPNQKAEEAIQQNLPFYIDLNAPYSLLNYSGTGGVFQKDKWYAWQVVAKDDKSYAAKSEVWVFKIKDSVPVKETKQPTYFLLDNSSSNRGSVVVDGTDLNIKYYSYDRDYDTEIRILTKEGKPIYTLVTKISYGDNYLRIKLPSKIESNQVYDFFMVDLKGNPHSLKFTRK